MVPTSGDRGRMAPCFQGTAVHPRARRASRPPTAVGKEAPAASAVTACVSGPVGLWGGGSLAVRFRGHGERPPPSPLGLIS